MRYEEIFEEYEMDDYRLLLSTKITDMIDLHAMLVEIRYQRLRGNRPLVFIFAPKEDELIMGTLDSECERYRTLRLLGEMLILTNLDHGEVEVE